MRSVYKGEVPGPTQDSCCVLVLTFAYYSQDCFPPSTSISWILVQCYQRYTRI